MGKAWTVSDQDYLREHCHSMSDAEIAAAIGRSVNSVKIKKAKLGLTRKQRAWSDEDKDFILKHKDTMTDAEMAEKLGRHVESVGEMRRRLTGRKHKPWTKEEEAYLSDNWGHMPVPSLCKKLDRSKNAIKQFKYGYAELSKMLGRSAGAIQRRICDLGLKERPIKADNHKSWEDWHFQTLADMIRAGCSYAAIGEVLGKSEKAIRGRVYDFYRTENDDKVRAMLGYGPWGTGKPELTVNDAKRRAGVKSDLTRLVELLLIRRNQLGYEPYWQRHMCMKWHDIKGCTAGQTNCDDCTEFQRIRPQYCVRCGATFFEREKNLICEPCRVARKKQHQRKWRRLQRVGTRAELIEQEVNYG